MKELKLNTSQSKIALYYQTFGKPIGTAPTILVNHALTGNSNVCGDNGWWKNIIGSNKVIDTNIYTVLAINIPGNGFDGKEENLITEYEKYDTKKIASVFWMAITELKIGELYAVIGGSLGGSIAWEMALQQPKRIQKLIPIACTYLASDWLRANVYIQKKILANSLKPIQDARMHAMLLYRTPESINQKFENKTNEIENKHQIESWLDYHGKTLQSRFHLAAYKLMNHLLGTIGSEITENKFQNFVQKTTTDIILISIDSDNMFTEKEQVEIFNKIRKNGNKNEYHIIKSIHGHDAFLIEYQQLTKIITNHFKQ